MQHSQNTNPWHYIPVGDQLWLFTPMIVLVCLMLIVVLCPMLIGRRARTIGTVTQLGVLLALALTIWAAAVAGGTPTSALSTQPSDGMLIVDNLSLGFQIVLLLFLSAILWLWSLGPADQERNPAEFFVLLLGSALGMALMVSTTNLLMIVVAIEMASLPSYAIVGFDKKNRKGAEASMKYLIFGAVCAAVMLYGVSLLYGMVGSLSAADVARYAVDRFSLPESRLLLSVSLFCLLGGIAFKISAVPFHFWCPDAFEGAKVEVTTWLSVASKAAGLVLLTRLVLIFCDAVAVAPAISFVTPLAWAIGIMAAVTCTVGNYSAYLQSGVKRLLAYSSIAHAGYMMMTAAVFLHPSSGAYASGLSALLAYVVIYLFMNLGAFGVTALVSWECGDDRIEAFTGLMRRNPWLAVPMIICLMSLVGLPPLAGFIGKWWILLALGGLNSTLGWFLVIVAVLNTLISLYYYLRIVVQIVLRDDGRPALRSSLGGLALVNVCAAMLLLLFVFPAPLRNTADHFSRRLFHQDARAAVHEAPTLANAME